MSVHHVTYTDWGSFTKDSNTGEILVICTNGISDGTIMYGNTHMSCTKLMGPDEAINVQGQGIDFVHFDPDPKLTPEGPVYTHHEDSLKIKIEPTCTCMSLDLFNFGCKCGHVQRERKDF